MRLHGNYGKETSVKLTLKPKQGALFVSSKPIGAQIYLDGMNTRRTTPAKFGNLEPKTYHIKLKLNGFVDYEIRRNIQPGGFENLHIRLTRFKRKKKIDLLGSIKETWDTNLSELRQDIIWHRHSFSGHYGKMNMMRVIIKLKGERSGNVAPLRLRGRMEI